MFPPPTYIPTWLTPLPLVLKNTKSPGCKFDLLTVLPYPDWALDVLGKLTPAAFLNT